MSQSVASHNDRKESCEGEQEVMPTIAAMVTLCQSLQNLQAVSQATIAGNTETAMQTLIAFGQHIEAGEQSLDEIRYRRSRPQFYWQRQEALLEKSLQYIDITKLNYLVFAEIISRINSNQKEITEKSQLATGFTILCRALGLSIAEVTQHAHSQRDNYTTLRARKKAPIEAEINGLQVDEKDNDGSIAAIPAALAQAKEQETGAAQKIKSIDKEITDKVKSRSDLLCEADQASELAFNIERYLKKKLTVLGIYTAREMLDIPEISTRLEKKYTETNNARASLQKCIASKSARLEVLALAGVRQNLEALRNLREVYTQLQEMEKQVHQKELKLKSLQSRVWNVGKLKQNAEASCVSIKENLDSIKPLLKYDLDTVSLVKLTQAQKTIAQQILDIKEKREQLNNACSESDSKVRRRVQLMSTLEATSMVLPDRNNLLSRGLGWVSSKAKDIIQPSIEKNKEERKKLLQQLAVLKEKLTALEEQKHDVLRACKAKRCHQNLLSEQTSKAQLQGLYTTLMQDKANLILQISDLQGSRKEVTSKLNELETKHNSLITKVLATAQAYTKQQDKIKALAEIILKIEGAAGQLVQDETRIEARLQTVHANVAIMAADSGKQTQQLKMELDALKVEKRQADKICRQISIVKNKVKELTNARAQAAQYSAQLEEIEKRIKRLKDSKRLQVQCKNEAETEVIKLEQKNKTLATTREKLASKIKEKQDELQEVLQGAYNLDDSIPVADEIGADLRASDRARKKDGKGMQLLDAHIIANIARQHETYKNLQNSLAAINEWSTKALVDPEKIVSCADNLMPHITKVQNTAQISMRWGAGGLVDQDSKNILQALWQSLRALVFALGRAFVAISHADWTWQSRASIFTNIFVDDDKIIAAEANSSFTALSRSLAAQENSVQPLSVLSPV